MPIDEERKKRLKEVYAYLREHNGIHAQKDMAAAMHITPQVMSAAMNGNDSYLTNNFFDKICVTFPGVFNREYLLDGAGELLIRRTDEHSEVSQSNMIDAVIAAKDEALQAHRRELEAKDEIIRRDSIIRERDMMIAELNARIVERDRTIHHQNMLIKELRARLSEDMPPTFGFSDGCADGTLNGKK